MKPCALVIFIAGFWLTGNLGAAPRADTLEETLERGVAAMRAGRLGEMAGLADGLEKTLAADTTAPPKAWHALGQWRHTLNQYAAAEAAFSQARHSAGAQANTSPDERRWTDGLLCGEQAVSIDKGGDSARALRAYEQALAKVRDIPEDSWARRAVIRQDAATARLRAGQPAEAVPLLRQAIADLAAAGQPAPVLAVPLNNLAAALQQSGDAAGAAAAAARSLDALPPDPLGSRLRWTAAVHRWTALLDSGEDARAAAALADQEMAAIWPKIGALARDMDALSLRSELSPLATRLNAPLAADPAAVEATAALWRRTQGAVLGQQLGQPAPCGPLVIPVGQALLVYAVAPRYLGRGRWEPSVSALILTPDAPPRILPAITPLAPLAGCTAFLRGQLQPGAAEDPARLESVLVQLGRALWLPLVTSQPALARVTRLAVCLDGPLAELPWAFFTTETGGPPLLETLADVVFVATPASAGAPRPAAQAGRAVAFDAGLRLSDPACSTPRGAVFPQSCLPFAPLPGTREEMRLLQLLMPTVDVRDGAGLTEAVFRKIMTASRPPDVLHFAGHAVCDPSPTPACLVFPNFGAAADGDSDDGVLTAAELAALPLRGTRLVTLSACDTGRGPALAGESGCDLARACHTAGARDVLLALGPLRDKAAPAFMRDFYRSFAAGTDAAAAAWAAQRRLWLAESASSHRHKAWKLATPWRLLRHDPAP